MWLVPELGEVILQRFFQLQGIQSVLKKAETIGNVDPLVGEVIPANGTHMGVGFHIPADDRRPDPGGMSGMGHGYGKVAA